jgi:hypothetical protein
MAADSYSKPSLVFGEVTPGAESRLASYNEPSALGQREFGSYWEGGMYLGFLFYQPVCSLLLVIA